MAKHKHSAVHERIAAHVITIVFEDDGQDFLEWDVDESGEVVDCRPFQDWVWKGINVVNASTLQSGDSVLIRRKDGSTGRILHRVQEVR